MSNTAVTLVFIDREGGEHIVTATVGDRLLDVAQAAGLEVEGACEGNMACATCHVILSDANYARLAPASQEEEDMLELAADLRPTSRLGCQIEVSAEMAGWTIMLPRQTQNLMGF